MPLGWMFDYPNLGIMGDVSSEWRSVIDELRSTCNWFNGKPSWVTVSNRCITELRFAG